MLEHSPEVRGLKNGCDSYLLAILDSELYIVVDEIEQVCKRYNVPVDRHRIKTSELGRVRAKRMKVLTKEQTTRIWV